MKRQLIAALLGLALAASVSSLAWGMNHKAPKRLTLIGAPPPECPENIPNCWPSNPGVQK